MARHLERVMHTHRDGDCSVSRYPDTKADQDAAHMSSSRTLRDGHMEMSWDQNRDELLLGHRPSRCMADNGLSDVPN